MNVPLPRATPAGEERAPMNVAVRLPRLRERLAVDGVDALIVSSAVNVRYLTGFTGSAGMLLVATEGKPGAVLVTDGRYVDQSAEEIEAAGVVAEIVIGSPAAQLAALGRAMSGRARVGFEADHLTWAGRARLAAIEGIGDDRLVPTTGVVEEGRLTKDPGEIDRMAAAAAIADAAFEAVVAKIAGWMSGPHAPAESDLATELEYEMRRRGSSAPAFETIVACGASAAMPHHRASTSPVEPGEPIVFDFGATVEGYRSDMTRTVFVGEPRGAEMRRIWDVVAESQAAGCAAVRAGVESREVDSACRKVIEAAGWGEAFLHGTGHGVGLDIHEAPWVAASSGTELPAGAVVTVEPGVYVRDIGGVRIEDTLAVTDGGYEALTRSPKVAVIS